MWEKWSKKYAIKNYLEKVVEGGEEVGLVVVPPQRVVLRPGGERHVCNPYTNTI